MDRLNENIAKLPLDQRRELLGIIYRHIDDKKILRDKASGVYIKKDKISKTVLQIIQAYVFKKLEA